MPILNEEFVNEDNISFKWLITLTNNIKGKIIFVDNKETNYIITQDARVFNIKTEKELKPFVIKKCGYLAVNIQLGKRGKYKTMTIHRLLGLAWIPNNDNKQIINHKDGDKLNLDLSNLEWSTYSENNKHAFDNNLKQPSKVKSEDCNLTLHTVDEVIKVCEYLQAGYTPKAIHNIFNFDYDFAQKIYKRKSWKNISCKYDFSRVILYNKHFTFEEIDKIMEIYDLDYSLKEIANYMNWEYNETLRGRLRQLVKQIKTYKNREAQEKLL